MRQYSEIASWISGSAFLAAFILTLWPNRRKLGIAGLLWFIGALAEQGFLAYAIITNARIAFAFEPSNGFPLFGWLIPLLRLALVITAGVLFLPRFSKERARGVAIVLFFFFFASLFAVSVGNSLRAFPVGMSSLGLAILWFRIRETTDANPEKIA